MTSIIGLVSRSGGIFDGSGRPLVEFLQSSSISANALSGLSNIAKIAGIYHAWREGKGYEDVSGFCKSAKLDEISGHGADEISD